MLALDNLIGLLEVYKYHLLFPVSVIEGPIISVIGGFLCSTGFLSVYWTYAVLIMGDMVGDTLYYSIGRFGGRPILRRWGKFLRFDEDRVIRTENHFKNHAGKTLLIGKTQAVGGIVLVAAGLSKMPFFRFLGFNLIGTSVKSLILLIVGFYFGKAYRLIETYLGYYAAIITALTLGILLVYFVFAPAYRKRRSKIQVQ